MDGGIEERGRKELTEREREKYSGGRRERGREIKWTVILHMSMADTHNYCICTKKDIDAYHTVRYRDCYGLSH